MAEMTITKAFDVSKPLMPQGVEHFGEDELNRPVPACPNL